jgi:4a-hydroxytetrahydrobiopterin dehydratase
MPSSLFVRPSCHGILFPVTLMNIRVFHRIKQILLIVSIVYFYTLAFVLQFDLPRYGLDRPIAFAAAGFVFFLALFIEASVTWWHRRRRILWGGLGILAYAVLGFLVGPLLYGWEVVWIPLIAPVVIVFVGGFAYAYFFLFKRAFFPPMKLSLDEVLAALASLPGWEDVADGLEKTFRFATYDEAVQFMTRAIVLSQTHHREPDITLTRRTVKMRIMSPDGGVMQADLDLAKELNAT